MTDLSLRHILFTCSSLSRTLDFWMSVMKCHMERQMDVGTRVRTCFAYPGDKVGIRFEYDRLSHRARQSSSLPTTPIGNVSLVIYVDSIVEYIARCKECGFGSQVYIDVHDVNELVRAAVLIDPNGIRLRLMQSSLFPINKQKCHGRLGYVSIPIRDHASIERAVAFYENTFATPTTYTSHVAKEAKWEAAMKKGTSYRMVDAERFVEDLTTYVWMSNASRKKSPAVCLQHKLIRRAIPMGNTTSTTTTTVSYTSRIQEQQQQQQHEQQDDDVEDGEEMKQGRISLMERHAQQDKGEELEQPLFLGLSFFVFDIEQAIGLLKKSESVPEARLEIQQIPGFARFIYFFDPAFVPVEITDGASRRPIIDHSLVHTLGMEQRTTTHDTMPPIET